MANTHQTRAGYFLAQEFKQVLSRIPMAEPYSFAPGLLCHDLAIGFRDKPRQSIDSRNLSVDAGAQIFAIDYEKGVLDA
jgi:hypothetical protein